MQNMKKMKKKTKIQKLKNKIKLKCKDNKQV